MAKSDRVDAQVLSEMGRALQLIPARTRSAERLRLSDLTTHRDDITAMIVAEQNRLRTTHDQLIWRNIFLHIRSQQASQARAEAEMEAVIQEQDDLRDRAARLRCIKGIVDPMRVLFPLQLSPVRDQPLGVELQSVPREEEGWIGRLGHRVSVMQGSVLQRQIDRRKG